MHTKVMQTKLNWHTNNALPATLTSAWRHFNLLDSPLKWPEDIGNEVLGDGHGMAVCFGTLTDLWYRFLSPWPFISFPFMFWPFTLWWSSHTVHTHNPNQQPKHAHKQHNNQRKIRFPFSTHAQQVPSCICTLSLTHAKSTHKLWNGTHSLHHKHTQAHTHTPVNTAHPWEELLSAAQK